MKIIDRLQALIEKKSRIFFWLPAMMESAAWSHRSFFDDVQKAVKLDAGTLLSGSPPTLAILGTSQLRLFQKSAAGKWIDGKAIGHCRDSVRRALGKDSRRHKDQPGAINRVG